VLCTMDEHSRQRKIRAALSPHENMLVGMAGGTLETFTFMPLLTWKFCSQEKRPYPRFPGMYRGVFVQVGSVAPLTATQMVANGVLQSAITGGAARELGEGEIMACGMGAGAFSALLYGPVDMLTIQAQRLGVAPAQAAKQLIASHGATSLWRGLWSTALREALYTSGYLSVAPIITRRIMQREGWEERYWASAVLGSCIAGVIANVLSHPVDTSKTLVQADVGAAEHRSARHAAVALFKKEGVRAFYRGGLARTIRGIGAYFIVSSLREQCIVNKTERDSFLSFFD